MATHKQRFVDGVVSKQMIKRVIQSSLLVILGATSFLTFIHITQAAVEGDGMIIYGSGTDQTPYYQIWSTSSQSFLSPVSMPSVGDTIKHTVLKSATTRGEMLAGIQTVGGVLHIQRWDGSQWTSEWSFSVGDSNVQRFDIAYEYTSGEALVVYSSNTNGSFYYRRWDGNSWTATSTYNTVRTSGTVNGIQLQAYASSSSNDIGIVWSDNATTPDLSANYWDGTNNIWKSEPSAALSTGLAGVGGTGAANVTWAYDLAFETNSGRLMVVWGNSCSTCDLNYNIRTAGAGGSWGSNSTATGFNEEPVDVELASSPVSNAILYVNNSPDTGNDSEWAVWSGSAWPTSQDTSPPCTASSSTCTDGTVDTTGVGTSNNSADWLVSGGNVRGIITYDDSNAVGLDWVVYDGTNIAVQTDCTTSCSSQPGGSDDRLHRSRVNPFNSAELMWIGVGASGDLFAKKLSLNGTTLTWSDADGGSALVNPISSNPGFAADFAYDRFIPITTTIGNGTNPNNATIAPGASATEIDAFTFQTSSGNDVITQATTTFSSDISAGLSKIEITNDAGTIVYGSTSTISGASVSINLNNNTLTATSGITQYKIRITPKSHAAMPAPSGAEYTATATITAWTGTNTKLGNDSAGASITIDNLSPANATGVNGVAGNASTTISWTNSTSSDFSQVVVLRNTTSISDIPIEGQTYNINDSIGTSIVRYVGNATSFDDTGLVNGTDYFYKVFTKDTNGNYSANGVETGPHTPAVPSISVSGSCKQWDQTTNCSDTGTLRVAINGVLDGATQATVGGTWTISGVTQPSANDIVTVFIDGAAAASNRAVAITKYDGSGNITGMTLFERHLVLGSDENPTLINADLAQYDYSASTNDADIIFDVDGSNNLTLDNLGNYSDERLLVRTGTTYQPSSVSNVTVNTHHFQASTSATVIANGNTFNTSGDWLNRGTFTQGTSSVVMSSTSASSVDHNGGTFYNFTATGSAIVNVVNTDFTVSNTLTANGTLDITSGRTINAQGTITIGGTISGAGRLTVTSSNLGTGGTLSSIVRFDATNGNITMPARTYGGLVEIFNSGSTARVVTMGSGTHNLSSAFNLLANGSQNITLDGATHNPTVNIVGDVDYTGTGGGSENITSGTGTWTLSGNADFTGGTYTAGSGNTLAFNGSSKTFTTGGNTFENIDFTNATSPTWSGNATSSGNVTLKSSMTMTGVTLTMTGTGRQISTVGGANIVGIPTFIVRGTASTTITAGEVNFTNLTVDSGATLAVGSGLISYLATSLTLNGTINGPGTFAYQSGTPFPTTGTINATLQYDISNSNMTMTARTYGGSVEVANNLDSNRVLTLAAGTHTIGGSLLTAIGGSGGVTINASSNNPTVTVAGSIDFTGVGGGAHAIQSGTGTWSVGGNVDFTGGTYSANTGNTVRLTGTGTLTTAGNTLQNLEFANTGTITLASATHTVSGNLSKTNSGSITNTGSTIVMNTAGTTIDSGSFTLILNNLVFTHSGTTTIQGTNLLAINGTLEVSTSTTINISSGATINVGNTFILNGTVNGAGRLIYTSTNVFPTTGTISSIVRYNAASNNLTMAARSYGGDVEILVTGNTNRTVTMATGSHIIVGNLFFEAVDNGNITLAGNTNNPTVSVGGNIDFIGTGAGTEILQTGTGVWTVSGNVDFTAGTFTANSGNLFIMNGANKSATSSSQSFYDLRIDGSIKLNDNTDINNDFTVSSSAVATSSSGTLTIARNFTNDGTFNHNSGTVVFDTSATSTISGTTSWNSLTVTTAGKGILFQAGVLQTINGVLILTGASGSEIVVQSTASGSQWMINHQGTENVSFIRLKDSGCHASSTNISTTNSINEGNNGSCWRFPAPDLTQIHYRWRNDDGNEANATFAAATDSQLSNWPQRTIIRLRMQISNEGTATSSGEQYRLEYGELNTVCSAISTWVPLANAGSASNQHWSLVNTSNISDGTLTTDSAGIANENTNFVAGEFRSQTNLTSVITLSTSSFTELEWALWAEQAANNNAVYCFRVTNNGSINDFTYSVYAQILVRTGGRRGPGDATEGSPPAATPTTGGTTQGGASGSEGGGVGGGGGTGGGTGQGGGGGGTP